MRRWSGRAPSEGPPWRSTPTSAKAGAPEGDRLRRARPVQAGDPASGSTSSSPAVDWKSSGDTRFAPLASAYGIECDGFWNHTPPRPTGRRLDRRADRQGAPATARAQGPARRAVPRHRAAAQRVRRDALQHAPRRQQPAQPRGHRLDIERARLLQPHRQPRLGDGAAARTRTTPAPRPPAPSRRRTAHRRRSGSTTRCGTRATSRATTITSWESGPSSTPTSRRTGVPRVESYPLSGRAARGG